MNVAVRKLLGILRYGSTSIDVSPAARIKKTTLEGFNRVSGNVKLMNSDIGFGSYISSNCVADRLKVGRYSSIGPNLKLPAGLHPTHTFVSTSPYFYSTRIPHSYVSRQKFEEYKYITESETQYRWVIGSDVWIGANVTILEGVRIGDGSVVGTGSIVTKDTPPFSISVGIPSKVVSYRFDADQIERLLQLKWWDKDQDWIKRNAELFENVNAFLTSAG